MKTCFKKSLVLPLLVAGLGSVLVERAPAQTFTTLHNFTGGSDGDYPNGLFLSGDTLYGTTQSGGSNSGGTAYKLNTDGTGFSVLHNFSSLGSSTTSYTNSDGTTPVAPLTVSGNNLYGTAYLGGSSGLGTVFKLDTDGTGFRTLHSFSDLSGGTNVDGTEPFAGLIISGDTLYGTAALGGSSGSGTVFKLNSDGTGFTILHSFAAITCYDCPNSDGANPQTLLILSGNSLYGTALYGGTSGNGTVFKVNIDGTGFTVLHSFTTSSSPFPFPFVTTNSDGARPMGLVLSDKILYGTASDGGSSGSGTLFKVNTDGTGFTTLYNTSSIAPLILSGNTLYGITTRGAIFAIDTDGTGFKTLRTGSDGILANGLVLGVNTLYGTGSGTIFSLSIPVELNLTVSGSNLVLSWPTNFTGYILQSTTNLSSPIWTTNLSAPVIVNGLNAVTNPFSGTQQFFRLGQ